MTDSEGCFISLGSLSNLGPALAFNRQVIFLIQCYVDDGDAVQVCWEFRKRSDIVMCVVVRNAQKMHNPAVGRLRQPLLTRPGPVKL